MKKMEQIAGIKAMLCTAIGAVLGWIVNMIGGWSEDLTTLLIFMAVDFFLGLAIAAHLSAKEMKWGFPQYQKKGLVINARAETVLERNMFRESVRRRRCIIPAGQYYEWDAQKNKVTFSGQDQPVLYLAGFFDRFQDGDHFVILTTAANASVSPVHDRMPLILEKEELESWIYDDAFLEFALRKVPAKLQKSQEYEQQTLF